ncbi:hypothetical protein PVK06_041332 [Gossypium arboreum]|uniref:Uncharacterized protein n=1 Tax=Gossypium arboreum TaxID=29729 RepID=A0ABR0N8T8_GOSAR|nr:hypothetical protein PVK06_041332 [Gossypium arboreum]
MWPASVAHTAQIGLGRVDHIAWPRISHTCVGPRGLNQFSPCVAHGLSSHHTAVSCVYGLAHRSHARVPSHGLPHSREASTKWFLTFAETSFSAFSSTHLQHNIHSRLRDYTNEFDNRGLSKARLTANKDPLLTLLYPRGRILCSNTFV